MSIVAETDRREQVDQDPVPADLLGHDMFAQGLLTHARVLSPGSVIAVQGGWGRGKTDVLRRLSRDVQAHALEHGWPPPIWINPWQYGKADLLTPLLAELISRRGEPSKQEKEIRKRLVSTLVRAANAMAFKAASIVVPSGTALDAAAKPVDEFISYLFGESGRKGEDVDPIAKMPDRFRELVDSCLEVTRNPDARYIICVDDLDRCLPQYQVGILEHLHFLTSARARATFFVAVDPVRLRHAIAAQYGAVSLDTNQYLSKIFNLRIDLPSIGLNELVAFVEDQLLSISSAAPRMMPSVSQFDRNAFFSEGSLTNWLIGLLSLPDLKNPRIVVRIFDRMRLFLRNESVLTQFKLDEAFLKACVVWFVICERWPSIRELCQCFQPSEVEGLFRVVNSHYNRSKDHKELDLAYSARLPDVKETPDLAQFIRDYGRAFSPKFMEIDKAAIASGL